MNKKPSQIKRITTTVLSTAPLRHHMGFSRRSAYGPIAYKFYSDTFSTYTYRITGIDIFVMNEMILHPIIKHAMGLDIRQSYVLTVIDGENAFGLGTWSISGVCIEKGTQRCRLPLGPNLNNTSLKHTNAYFLDNDIRLMFSEIHYTE